MIFKPETTNRFITASLRWTAGGLVLFALFPLPQARASVDSLMRRAYHLYLRGSYREAESLYLRASREDPRDAGALYGAGACEYRLQNPAAAKDYLQKAVALDPGLRKARALLKMTQKILTARQVRDVQFILLMAEGVLNYRMHHYPKALAVLGKAAALKPDSADLHFNLGLVYLKLKKWDRAQAELEECLRLKPGDRKAEYALGVVYEKVGAMSLAKDYFLTLASSPDAGVYNWDALHRLSTLHSDVPGSNSAFHFFLRLQGSGGQDTVIPEPNAQPLYNSSTNQYGHLQLGFSPWMGKPDIGFSYTADGIWSQSPGQDPYFAHLHDFSVNAALHLSHWAVPLSFDEQVGFDSRGKLFYEHHQASAACQWFFTGSDMLQAQVQYLREIYPSPVDLTSDNWTGSVSSLVVLGPHFFNLSYSFRQCLPDTSESATYEYFYYFLHTLSLTYHVELGGGWNATLTYSPQWQVYPYFNYVASSNTPRRDFIQNLGGEFTLPVTSYWNFVVGDQYQDLESNTSGYTHHSNNYYAGTQFFF